MLRTVDLVVLFSLIWFICMRKIFGDIIFLLQSAHLNGYHMALSECCSGKLYAKF